MKWKINERLMEEVPRDTANFNEEKGEWKVVLFFSLLGVVNYTYLTCFKFFNVNAKNKIVVLFPEE